MANVRFIRENIVQTADKGDRLLDVARECGVVIESPCNAGGTCGKCKVKIDPKQLDRVLVKKPLPPDEAGQGYVLACMTEVLGDVDVTTLSGQKNKTLKIVSEGQSFEVTPDSAVMKAYRDGVTRVYAGETLLCEEKGDTTDRLYGLVVDIGTTTLVAAVVDLNKGRELATCSALNPQSLYAQDVLSRIKIASDEEGLQEMHDAVTKEINRMAAELCVSSGVPSENIYEAVFSGNTTMIHLAAKINPYSLGQFPYTPQLYGSCHFPAETLGVNISRYGLVYFPPIISAYVGPDITSGILASQLHRRPDTTLFVDIGTNGEMAIGKNGALSATSTAAGPAFEGMNITFGMRASNGAIEYFEITRDADIVIRTIGDAAPVGICGSGLLDIVGELVANKVIDKNGRFVKPEGSDLPEKLKARLTPYQGKPAFRLVDEVYLTQKDIRQVQLAKGAVRAGIEYLMSSQGVRAREVGSVLIAGSFGYHLRAKSLLNIGMLPEEFEGRISFIGNTSQSGGKAFLMNRGYRREMEALVKTISVIELSTYEDFDKLFVKCLGF
ncbi:MAG: ASKHA domain-containing protein [Bacillota bacterium]